MYYDSSEEFLPEKKNSPTTPSVFLARIMTKLVAFNRYICYRKFPTLIFSYLGIPTSVGTFLVVMATTLYTLLYCFVPHPFYRPCAGFGSPPLSVRAGIMAISLVPFVFSLSGKINVIGWLVGLSYEKSTYTTNGHPFFVYSLAGFMSFPSYVKHDMREDMKECINGGRHPTCGGVASHPSYF